jgi:hypothetical protein
MSLNGTVWAPIGPSPMKEGGNDDNGLVTAIAVNPNNNKVLYLGAAQGGVWRSGDGGLTWTPLFDRQFALGIGEPAGIAIDPNNTDIVYVGTSGRVGSAEPDTIHQQTQGLFKSTDGGASWIALGSGFPAGNTGNATQFVNQTINVIIVDPANSSVVYLATNFGVFVSPDGGENWTPALGISGDTRSLALDLSTPPNNRFLHAGVSGVGAFISKNGGSSFSQTLSATTSVVASALGGKGFTRVVVAPAPPTSPPALNGVQVLYVAIAGPYSGGTDPVGIFVSKDQGVTWAQATGATPGSTYGGYAIDMVVDPASPGNGTADTLIFGCQNQYKSTNSGGTFTPISVGHADVHTFTCVPQTGGVKTVVYCGCDGGIFVSSDAGSTWSSLNKKGLQIGLFYNIAVKPDATASATAGALQDNSLETTAGVASPAWKEAFTGDGWDVAYDNTGVLYGASGGPATSIASSTDDGQTYPTPLTPPWTSTDTGGFLLTQIAADPNTSGVIYASGAQNLWQRLGGTWRIILSPGTSGNVDVAPTNGNNVVIAAGTQVFVSTNAQAATATFANITRNLPSRSVARAVFDPVDPNIIYAVMNGFSTGAGQNVFRTTITATSWTNISPPVDIPCGAIAVDGTTTPTTLYVGTDLGVIRSVNGGASWTVLDDIHFPRAPVFDLGFNPQAGVLRAATYGRGVFEFMKPAGPAIAVGLEDGLAFGEICKGPAYLTLTVTNVGSAELDITSVQVLFGSSDFSVLPNPATPVAVDPGEDIAFTVRFAPSTSGSVEAAIIRVISNDPNAPFVDVAAIGKKGTGRLTTAIADSGAFPDVCLGAFADEPLVLNNSGDCALTIFGVGSSSPDFLTPAVSSYPIVIAAGASVALPIRFRPNAFGAHAATITIFSNDPASPSTVSASGVAPSPRLVLAIADSGNFGPCCVGSFVDEPLLLANAGQCALSVTGIISSTGSFLVPEALSFPLTIGPGDALSVPIRFQPTAHGPASAVITVTSDDPASPAVVAVSGNAPWGKLAVAGSAVFDGVKCCRHEQRRLSICNVGDCALNVRKAELKGHHKHFRLINNPFPAPLHPGSCLDLVIDYHAVQHAAKPCELLIESDDPDHPVRCVDVIAWTIWGCCEDRDCDCRKEKCERRCECERRRKRCDDDHNDDDHDHEDERRRHE